MPILVYELKASRGPTTLPGRNPTTGRTRSSRAFQDFFYKNFTTPSFYNFLRDPLSARIVTRSAPNRTVEVVDSFTLGVRDSREVERRPADPQGLWVAMFHQAFRGGNSTIRTRFRRFSGLTASPARYRSRSLLPLIVVLLVAGGPLSAREKEKLSYGEGLIVNIPMPESQVVQVVEDVSDNGVIRGTKEYNKDEFVSGAKAAATSRVFPDWTGGGKVFYKVREHAIDPRNFKDGGDVGTLVVRYVVQPQGEKNTVLRIDALFQEDFRRTVHQSDGSVENSEYKDIREHLENIKLMQAETAEAEKARQTRLARKQTAAMSQDADAAGAGQSTSQTLSQTVGSPDSSSTDTAMQSSSRDPSQYEASETQTEQAAPGQAQAAQSLEERVKELRKQVQRLVKSPGAPLKSAPFHTAGTLQLLGTGTEVLILINTPYWYGVETHEGQHGWVMRDQLEQP